MSSVNVLNVTVMDNPAPFLSPLKLDITFECIAALPDDLEWKLTYVGSAERKEFDQVLENVVLGPVAVGSYRFTLQAKSPDWSRIPRVDLVGVTVVLLSCFYRAQEFIRVGYYVNNAYLDDPSQPPAASPVPPAPQTPPLPLPDPSLSWPDPHQPQRIIRNILADNPRVTLFPIQWDPEAAAREDAQREAELKAQHVEVEEEDMDEDDDDEEEEEENDEEDEEEEGSYNEDEEMTDAHDIGDSDSDEKEEMK